MRARPRLLRATLAGALLCAMAPVARADRQEDPGLRAVLEQAIASTRCDGHDDRFGSEVFFKLHEPQLRIIVKDAAERVEILRSVYCEAHRVTARYHDKDGVELRLGDLDRLADHVEKYLDIATLDRIVGLEWRS